MKIVYVDDEPLAIDYIASVCRELSEDIWVIGFTKVNEALEWIRANTAEIALLDIDMPEVDGITLAARIKQIRPDMAILFLTAYKKFAFDAYSVRPTGYLLKPVLPEVLKKELDYAMSLRPKNDVPHIEARTFGTFELFVDGELVGFRRAKSKELLAFLIDRRGMCVSRAELSAALFEDTPYDRKQQKYLDTIIRSLRDDLRGHGADDILRLERNGLRIVPEKIKCDMYRFYGGDSDVINSFRGEYMCAYPWAEFIEGDMCAKSKSKL